VVQVELAEKTAVLFTKDGDQHNNLFDMQCMWLVVLFTLCLSGAKAIWAPLKYVCYSACMFTLLTVHPACMLFFL
jgi:hypothetical protein